jgi:aspartyl protease/PDZ domain-containing protein
MIMQMKNAKWALIISLCCILNSPFAIPRIRADEPTPKSVTIPFELLKTQHMAIKIKINGKGPYRVIFDTGAPTNLINNKVAKEAGIITKDTKRPLFAFFGSMGDFKIKSLEIGDLKIENVPTIVMDHPTVSLIDKFMGPVEGLVGFPFFARYKMTIDYQKKEMTFSPGTFDPPDVMKTMMKTIMAGNQKKILAPAGQWGFKVAKEAKDSEPGVNVKEVLAGSPAARGGLKAGDRLLILAGRWTDSVADCYAAASYVPPGSEARLRIRRDGKEMELTVKVQAGL